MLPFINCIIWYNFYISYNLYLYIHIYDIKLYKPIYVNSLLYYVVNCIMSNNIND